MSRPDINDLMYRYFGGGTDAQYDFYAEAADRGITARDVLSGGASGTPLERFERERQSIILFDDFLTDPVERGTFAASGDGDTAAVVPPGRTLGFLALTLGEDSVLGDHVSVLGQAYGPQGFYVQTPTMVEWFARIPHTGESDFTAKMGVQSVDGLTGDLIDDGFIGFEYLSQSTNGINLLAEPVDSVDFSERVAGKFWSGAFEQSLHRFQLFFDPVAPRVEFVIDGELVGEHTDPNLFGSGFFLKFLPCASMTRHTERIGAAKELTVDYSLVIIEAAR